jgi:hypothetical protein
MRTIYLVNNRPVPKAIARARLSDGLPHDTPAEINKLLEDAKTKQDRAVRLCAYMGVHIETTGE